MASKNIGAALKWRTCFLLVVLVFFPTIHCDGSQDIHWSSGKQLLNHASNGHAEHDIAEQRFQKVQSSKSGMHLTSQRELVIFLSIVMVGLWICLGIFIAGAIYFCKTKQPTPEEAKPYGNPPGREYGIKKSMNLCIVVGGMLTSILMLLFGCVVLALGAIRLKQEETSSTHWLLQPMPGIEYDTLSHVAEFGRPSSVHDRKDPAFVVHVEELDATVRGGCESLVSASIGALRSFKGSFASLHRMLDTPTPRDPRDTDSELSRRLSSEVSLLKVMSYSTIGSLERYLSLISGRDDVYNSDASLYPGSGSADGRASVAVHPTDHPTGGIRGFFAKQGGANDTTNKNMTNKAYIIFPAAMAVVLLSVLFTLPVFVGTFLGLFGTGCFKTYREHFYKRSSLSHSGARLMETGYYTTSVFLWIFWALAALIFIVSAIPVDSCILLRKLQISEMAENITDNLDPSEFGMLSPRLRKIISSCEGSTEYFPQTLDEDEEAPTGDEFLDFYGTRVFHPHEAGENNTREGANANVNGGEDRKAVNDMIIEHFETMLAELREMSERLTSLCSSVHEEAGLIRDRERVHLLDSPTMSEAELSCSGASKSLLMLQVHTDNLIRSCLGDASGHKTGAMAFPKLLRHLMKQDQTGEFQKYRWKHYGQGDDEYNKRIREAYAKHFFAACIRAARQEAMDFTCDTYLYSVATCWLGLCLIATFSLTTVLFSIPAVNVFRFTERSEVDSSSSGFDDSHSRGHQGASPSAEVESARSNVRSDKLMSSRRPEKKP